MVLSLAATPEIHFSSLTILTFYSLSGKISFCMNHKNPDASIHIRQPEQMTTTIPFSELTRRLTQEYPQQKKPGFVPTTIHFFGIQYTPEGNIPYLGASFDPPLGHQDNELLGVQMYGISNARTKGLLISQMTEQPEELIIYNVDVKQLLDPHFDGDVCEFDAREVMVAGEQTQADKTGSWIQDEKLRQRIEEYVANQMRIKTVLKLRRALSDPDSRVVDRDPSDPFAGTVRFTYDYAGIREAVDKRNGDNRFTGDDVVWLEKHMQAKGISF